MPRDYAKEKAARAARAASRVRPTEGTKVCRDRGDEKHVLQFSEFRASPDGLAYVCKPCGSALTRRWERENPEKRRAAHDRWAEANAEKVRASRRAWKAANQLLVREQTRRRRARLRTLTVERVDYREILRRDNWTCHICRLPVEPADLYLGSPHETGKSTR